MDVGVRQWQSRAMSSIFLMSDKEKANLYCKLNCYEWIDTLPECEYSQQDDDGRRKYGRDKDNFDYNWWLMEQIKAAIGDRIISKSWWELCFDDDKIVKWEDWYNKSFGVEGGYPAKELR